MLSKQVQVLIIISTSVSGLQNKTVFTMLFEPSWDFPGSHCKSNFLPNRSVSPILRSTCLSCNTKTNQNKFSSDLRDSHKWPISISKRRVSLKGEEFACLNMVSVLTRFQCSRVLLLWKHDCLLVALTERFTMTYVWLSNWIETELNFLTFSFHLCYFILRPSKHFQA